MIYIPQNITTLVPNVQIKSRNRVISTPSFIDSLPNISQRSTDEKEKKKDNLFLTTYHIPKDKLIENKIKKIYLKHNLFTNPKKKNNPISPTLSLIKETDLTKKRYYFGFMSETTINSNNNTNSLIKTKRNTSIKSIRNDSSFEIKNGEVIPISKRLFQDVKNKAFSLFMKKDVYAKQLSNYTDHCMRTAFKGKSQEEMDKILNDIIDLFKCLNSKLIFQN